MSDAVAPVEVPFALRQFHDTPRRLETSSAAYELRGSIGMTAHRYDRDRASHRIAAHRVAGCKTSLTEAPRSRFISILQGRLRFPSYGSWSRATGIQGKDDRRPGIPAIGGANQSLESLRIGSQDITSMGAPRRC